MISSTSSDMSKGKEIVDTHSMTPIEALYHAIQSTFDASDSYHVRYWLDSPLPTLDYLLQTYLSN